MRIACDRPWLGVDLGAPHRVLSWAVHCPGLVSAQRILWREVRDADLTPDLDVAPWLAAELAARDESGSVAMLTSRDVRRHNHAVARIGGIEVEALATVGRRTPNAWDGGASRTRRAGGRSTWRSGSVPRWTCPRWSRP